MLEQIILGIVQGITEWLPVSSEGVIVLIAKNFLKEGITIETVVKQALFLHLGTFLAALVYFRKDVLSLIKTLFNYKSAKIETQKIFKFLLISFLISGFLGFALLKIFIGLEDQISLSAKAITLLIGFLLLITAYLQIKAPKQGHRKSIDLKNTDSVLLGLIQGLAVLPGLSRSGLTVSTLLLRKFDDQDALKLSFLMSLPIVLAGNIILNFNDLIFSNDLIWGLIFSFIFGLLTIDLLLKIAKRINFGYFVLIFGLLVLGSVFI